MSRFKLEVCLAGAFGGLAPNLIGMASQALRAAPDPEVGYLFANFGFWVGALTLAFVGGSVAHFYRETSVKKAVALGAAAPALLLGLAQGSPSVQLSQAPAVAGTAVSWIMGTVYAQEPMPTEPDAGRFWIAVSGLKIVKEAEVDLVAVLSAEPLRPSARSLPSELVLRLSPTDSVVPVPRNAREVYVRLAGVTSNRLAIPRFEGDTLGVLLEVPDRSFITGLARSLGFRNVKSRRPEIQIRPPNEDGESDRATGGE